MRSTGRRTRETRREIERERARVDEIGLKPWVDEEGGRGMCLEHQGTYQTIWHADSDLMEYDIYLTPEFQLDGIFYLSPPKTQMDSDQSVALTR